MDLSENTAGFNLIMSNSLEQEIQNYISSNKIDTTDEIRLKVQERLNMGNLVRDENSESHFCAFFVAIDKDEDEIFIGLHKKSGLWLPNGGHIDTGETPLQTVEREIGEEWGDGVVDIRNIKDPELVTIQLIENSKQTCKIHFDIWFFIDVSKSKFHPDENKLKKEYGENKWAGYEESKGLHTSTEVLEMLDYLSKTN